MDNEPEPDSSQLFLVRVWADQSGNDDLGSVHGKVQIVLSGQAARFGDWESLITHMIALMRREYVARGVPVERDNGSTEKSGVSPDEEHPMQLSPAINSTSSVHAEDVPAFDSRCPGAIPPTF